MRKQNAEVEIARIEKTKSRCSLCEDYAKSQAKKPVAVLCCEGACLRGEFARRAADMLCHELAPAKTARVCLGSAFTKDTGQRRLVRKAQRVLVLEGCPVACASRMIRGVLPGLKAEIVFTDGLTSFDTSLFGTDEMPAGEIRRHAAGIARRIAKTL